VKEATIMAITTNRDCANVGGTAGEEELTQAVVESIKDGLATLLVGPLAEEWEFPSHLLPREATEGCTLILEGSGRNFEIIGIAAGPDGVEDRLSRSLSKRRRIVFPLPHREIPVPVAENTTLSDRPSRLFRDLGTGHKDR
jgi:hypothetical protein